MCSNSKYGNHWYVITSVILLFNGFAGRENALAQQVPMHDYPLSLNDAIALAKTQNLMVLAAKTEANATAADLKDAYNAALPLVNASASYQRFSDLTLYTDGFNHSATGPRKPGPNAANLGIDASFTIYAGGKQQAMQQEAMVKNGLAATNFRDQAGFMALQTAAQYLDLVRLAELKKFILDQLKRAEARLKNINALYRNQKVTKSDVLRAEVMLSNVQLAVQQSENDLQISSQKINNLLNLPDTVKISITDSAGMSKPDISRLSSLTGLGGSSSFSVQKANQGVEIQLARLNGLKSGFMPTLSFITAYGLNYPNNLFFPPVDQAYSIGYAGLRAQYNISSLYQHKNKVAAGKIRLKEAHIQQQSANDNVQLELRSLLIKYGEALNRIGVNQRSIEQAKLNYRIVNTKYFNQLALLTDLLDADNLYTESRFNLVKAQTDALLIYYRLQYAAGNL